MQNAKKYTTFHPRCGTTFIFFLLFISIIIFSGLFSVISVGAGQHFVVKHILAIVIKILLTFPVTAFSYELIKFSGKYSENLFGKILSYPGMLLQRLTTKEPDEHQLEVALASIKMVLFLEDKYNLKEATEKIITLDEVDIKALAEVEISNLHIKDFLEN